MTKRPQVAGNPLLSVRTNVIPIERGQTIRAAGDALDYFGQLRDAQSQAERWQTIAVGLGLYAGYLLYDRARKRGR